MIEICAVGGYSEVGRNCTAINVDGDVIIIDMGLHLEKYIQYSENEEIEHIDVNKLIKSGAVPDISKIDSWKKDVKAIIPTHAHLDHVGAIPFLAQKFQKAEIIGTRFTLELLKAIVKDEGIVLKNNLRVLNTTTRYKITKNISIEFVNMTHSTPQTVSVAVYTKYGIIVYANDFKLDNTPTLGKKPDYDKLRKIGKEGCMFLIMDTLYATYHRKTPSEAVAAQMLEEVMLGTESRGRGIIVTTFSSHIARMLTIMKCAKKLNRRVIFLGRSLGKYLGAAEACGLGNFSRQAEIVKYGKKIRKALRRLQREKDNYVIVCTGHQGEPNSVLWRIAKRDYDFEFDPGDLLIFSCNVIPTKINQHNRLMLEEGLKDFHLRMFKDIHQSGHASREDHRDMLEMLKPRIYAPGHSPMPTMMAAAELAYEMGYKKNNVVLLREGDRIKL
jgi:ribonuclease J